jgi:hypothetical protein
MEMATGPCPRPRRSGWHFNRTHSDLTAAQSLATEIEPDRRW